MGTSVDDDGGGHGADGELMEWLDPNGLGGRDGATVTIPQDGSGDLEC